MQLLSDEGLKNKTDEFKGRYQAGESLDDLMSEAFAVVREASQRVLQMRPFNVQLVGGVVLNEGNIAEMKTGEGKGIMCVTHRKEIEELVQVMKRNGFDIGLQVAYMGEVYD